MKKSTISKGLFFLLMMMLSQLASAHSGHNHTDGFLNGLAHPLTGFDHLVAMLALGIWAGQYRSRQTCNLPVLFTCAMMGGAILFLRGNELAGLEIAILLSIPVLLLLTGMYRQIRTPFAILVAISFGLIHGAAHGLEISAGTSSLAYVAGMGLMSIILQGTGVLISNLLNRQETRDSSIRSLAKIPGKMR